MVSVFLLKLLEAQAAPAKVLPLGINDGLIERTHALVDLEPGAAHEEEDEKHTNQDDGEQNHEEREGDVSVRETSTHWSESYDCVKLTIVLLSLQCKHSKLFLAPILINNFHDLGMWLRKLGIPLFKCPPPPQPHTTHTHYSHA